MFLKQKILCDRKLTQEVIMMQGADKKRILTYVAGLLYFYGAVELRVLYRLVAEKIPVPDREEFAMILDNEAADEDGLYYFDIAGGYCYLPDVDDMDWVLNEQSARSALPWRPVSEEEARAIVAENYQFIWNEQDRKLYDLLYNDSDGDAEIAVHIVEDLAAAIKNDADVMELIPDLAEDMEIKSKKDLKVLTETLVGFYNNQPQWALKGWSPHEAKGMGEKPAAENVVAFTKKAGRNEPCPCGSGKKFKKCCLSAEKPPVGEEKNLSLSPEEYEALAIMTYISEWVILSHEIGEERKGKKLYRDVKDKVFSQAGKFGKEKMIFYSPEFNMYDLEREYGDEGIATKLIDEYDEEGFWELLTLRLAKRDLWREYGEEGIEKMDRREYFSKMQEKEEMYHDAFCRDGLDALILRKNEE